jgi:hypothetical protein
MAGRPKRRARLAAASGGEDVYAKWERESGAEKPVFAELTEAKYAVLDADAGMVRLATLLSTISPEGRKALLRSIPREGLGGLSPQKWLAATIGVFVTEEWIDCIKSEREEVLYEGED